MRIFFSSKVSTLKDFQEVKIKPTAHIIWSLAISSCLGACFHSLSSFLVSFLAGIFIDVDHVIDYYVNEKVTLNLRKMYVWCARQKHKFVYIWFHSIELIIILWIIITVFRLGLFWIALAVGLTQHLILDIIFNHAIVNNYAYFLTYRISKGFNKSYIFKK